MNLLENIRIALRNIRGNLLRTILTLLIIGFGIMALVGILTSIEGLKQSITKSFSQLGSNSFYIDPKGAGMLNDTNNNFGNSRAGAPIIYAQAQEFKDQYSFPATISVSFNGNGVVTVSRGDKKTNPNIQVEGIDENYEKVQSLKIDQGREFNLNEIKNGSDVVIVGQEIYTFLFKDGQVATGQFVSVNGKRYQVIAVLQSSGESNVSNTSRTVFVPILNAIRNYGSPGQTVEIACAVSSLKNLNAAIDEATSTMRNIRGIRIGQGNDFEITKSDALAKLVVGQISFLTIAAFVIGIITLLGAAIGLMNIMLVSVTERTREIGISKAIGATKREIRIQFLTEAIVICMIGGILGIILGMLAGNGVSIAVSGSFVIPWVWIGFGILFCLVVGLLSGIYPAIKASQLDPIEALRYE